MIPRVGAGTTVPVCYCTTPVSDDRRKRAASHTVFVFKLGPQEPTSQPRLIKVGVLRCLLAAQTTTPGFRVEVRVMPRPTT